MPPRRKKYQQKTHQQLEQSVQDLSKIGQKKEGPTQPSITFEHLAESSNIIIEQEIDPKKQAIITQNVPFLTKVKISYWYISVNTGLLILYFIFIIILPLTTVSDLTKILIGCFCGTLYLIYLFVIIKYSNIWEIIYMRSVEQFSKYFYSLVDAKTYFKFTIIGSKVTGLQKDAIKQLIYEPSIIDRSGKLYEVQKDTSLLIIHFHKKYYFENQKAKQKIIKKHDKFTSYNNLLLDDTNKAVKSKKRVEFIIQDFSYHKCFYKDDNVSPFLQKIYLGLFFASFILGFGIIYEYIIQRKILRVEITITKQITTKINL